LEWILAENHGEFMGLIVNNMILGFVGFVQELGCIPQRVPISNLTMVALRSQAGL